MGRKPRAMPWAGMRPRRWRSIWRFGFSSVTLMGLDEARSALIAGVFNAKAQRREDAKEMGGEAPNSNLQVPERHQTSKGTGVFWRLP